MAPGAAATDLSVMYTSLAATGVRDLRARYGEQPGAPEAFTAEAVLEDLRHASDADLPLVLARYAAVRAWALRGEGSDAAEHAVSAAEAHLAAADPAWPEGPLLRRLLGDGRAGPLLEEAAARAAARGHEAGARALRSAALRLRWRDMGLPPLWPS